MASGLILPTRTDPDALAATVELRRLGWSHKRIARVLGCDLRTVYRRLDEADRLAAGEAARRAKAETEDDGS